MKKPALLSKLESDTAASKDTSSSAQFAKFSKENPLFALLTPAIFTNAQNQSEYRKGPVVGYAAIKDTGKLREILERPEIKNILPRDLNKKYSSTRFAFVVDSQATNKRIKILRVSSH